MTLLRPSFSARDTIAFFIGAAFTFLVITPLVPSSLGLNSRHSIVINRIPSIIQSHLSGTQNVPISPTSPFYSSPFSIGLAHSLPETTIVHHAPGWTLFRNLYMSNGTLFLLSSEENRSAFPPFRMMTSTGIRADNHNMELWEPTKEHMDFLSPEEAKKRWGGEVLVDDHRQFIVHFYHFVAELMFGVQAFWHGSFSTPIPSCATVPSDQHLSDDWPSKYPGAYPVTPNTTHPSAYSFENRDEEGYELEIPKIDRIIFKQIPARGWNDVPGFDAYFLRAAFPALTVEGKEDWDDRVESTRPHDKGEGLTTFVYGEDEDEDEDDAERDVKRTGSPDRAFHFPLVLVVDRLSSFQGEMTGRYTQRPAATAYEYMRGLGRIRGERVGGWWEPLRGAVVRWAGGQEAEEPKVNAEILGKLDGKDEKVAKSVLPMPDRMVVTYISRQGGPRRRLIDEAHNGLVAALEEVCGRRGWELNVVLAERLSKDEQVKIAARTTILLGVHGNGLLHLVFMPPTRISTVIEIFFPGGFTHDYHWTSRALGMDHFAVWNDTYMTYPNEPLPAYPDGFQGDQIPVHGPTVAKIVEDRVDGRL